MRFWQEQFYKFCSNAIFPLRSVTSVIRGELDVYSLSSVCAVIFAGQLAASVAFAQTPSPPPFGPTVESGRALALTDLTNPNPLIPVDIYRNASVSHADLATFAWLEFISAVAPAATGLRGVPGGSFAASGEAAGGSAVPLLVWETYQHRTELLPCNVSNRNAGQPQTWGASPNYVTAVASSNPQECSTIAVSGSSLPFNNLDEATQIAQNALFYPATPGSPQPGADAQVLFEAKVNQVEFRLGEPELSVADPEIWAVPFFPAITLPFGTVEVKAAWRPLSSIPQDQQNRYHTATVITYSGSDEQPKPELQTYALIALHIIHKTPNYPAFIFATFEQVDDLTNQLTGNPTGLYYVPTYASVAYTLPSSTTFPPSMQTVPNPSINFNVTSPMAYPKGTAVSLPIGEVASVAGAVPLPNNNVAVPVTQPVATTPEVAAVDSQALALMRQLPGFGPNFTWQYYKLAGVQALPTNDETSEDFYLANIVVESQPARDPVVPRLPANLERPPPARPNRYAQSGERYRLRRHARGDHVGRRVPRLPRNRANAKRVRLQLPVLRRQRRRLLPGHAWASTASGRSPAAHQEEVLPVGRGLERTAADRAGIFPCDKAPSWAKSPRRRG